MNDPVLPPIPKDHQTTVLTSALVIEHRLQPPARHLHWLGQYQVSLGRFEAIDLYPATPTNHNPEA